MTLERDERAGLADLSRVPFPEFDAKPAFLVLADNCAQLLAVQVASFIPETALFLEKHLFRIARGVIFYSNGV
jgi:hypothetical protein